ncbi:MAG: sigma-70 family RNA polymerase sigma factor [Oscillibacter sp.]|nr:sigma-70 family RNA polymerase sigma factor [Oscillibacter sp.]
MLVCYLQMLDTPEEKIRFEQIYLKYRGLMYHVADRILHNRQDAEDTVHNAFLQIIKHFKKFQDTRLEDLTPQIVVLTKNEAISFLRKKKNEAPLEDGESLADASEAILDYQALVDSFTRLPQTYRAVMEMKLLLGYSDGEIAAKLGLTKTAVSTRINRGRLLLRNIVEQEGFLREA